MYNHFMLMGRLVKDPEFVEFDDGKKVMNINLAVRKSFKNIDGEYETEFYRISFWEYQLEQYKAYLKTGMAVFVKGRMQNTVETLMNGYEISYHTLVGERLVYFTSPKATISDE